MKPDAGSAHGDASSFTNTNDNGFLGNANSVGNLLFPREESTIFSTTSEQSRLVDPRLETSRRSIGAVSALRELVRS